MEMCGAWMSVSLVLRHGAGLLLVGYIMNYT